MFTIGYAVCQTLNRTDRPQANGAEAEREFFEAEARKLTCPAHRPVRERLRDAALSLVPSRLRKAWTDRILEREFTVQCARLKDLSPHLLEDIGVEEVTEERKHVMFKIETLPTSIHASIAGHGQRLFALQSREAPKGAQPA